MGQKFIKNLKGTSFYYNLHYDLAYKRGKITHELEKIYENLKESKNSEGIYLYEIV